ncbi:zinc finger protein 629-like [Sitophilus oryzae]|uniref:Zinc finger protein 629-like n=1 Tax=Sitophilus oryzae TaxID=7048 RepID=A0A6J2YBW4_SITOR|nr:zinc finger protein 629-like [Sitophilus oryzae]
MGSEHYCLRWNNHQANLLGVCAQLLRDERLVDVTLACADEGRCIRAHKVVLSACSAYFRALFVDHPARHPIVILKDVRFSDLRTLVEFMYKGEVRVEYAQLSRLLQTAESLKVKGLAEMTREYKPEPPEQTEPEELVNRRPPSAGGGSLPPSAASPTPRNSPLAPTLIPQPPPTRQSPEPASAPRPPSQNGSPDPPPPPLVPSLNSFGPPPASGAGVGRPSPPPINCAEPVPGPSNMPPVQQVPLSLKKEVDWGGGMDDKNSGGESSSDYSRLPHDSPVLDVEQQSGGSSLDRPPSSASSSRASTPGAPLLPFPLAGFLEAGLVPPLDGLGAAAFRCGACLAGFPSPWLLEQHAALQHLPGAVGPDKPFVCDQCGQSYRYRSAYVKHREQNHRARLPADKLFSCDVCGMQFRYLKSFKKHRLNHALERLHGTRRPSGGDSSTSVAVIVQGEQGSDQVSSSNEALMPQEEEGDMEVKVKVEPETDDAGGCEGGSTMDTDKQEAEQDDTIDSRVSASLSTSTSELLRADGTDAAALATLLRAEANDSSDRQRERRFACPFCGKCVRSKENLKLHVRKHTGERPFVCLFCGRAFGGKSDLTRHLRIHTGERPYHCDMCGKCFARADYLSKHLTTHINTPR